MLVHSHEIMLLPPWLQVFLSEKFFSACVAHQEAKKNEKNIFCLDCCLSLCPHCLSLHPSHRLLQIRRYVYHDVLRLGDAQKLFDCSYVQSYTTNSAKVVFLKQRPQTRQFRGFGNICSACDRSLQDPYLFCSLSCKMDHIFRTQGPNGFLASGFLLYCDHLSLPEPGSDEVFTTPDSVLEPAGSTRTFSESGGYAGVDVFQPLACTATTSSEMVVRKKRSSLSGAARIFPRISEIPSKLISNRRKNTPNRAPLY